jgi:hypothetical protein
VGESGIGVEVRKGIRVEGRGVELIFGVQEVRSKRKEKRSAKKVERMRRL